jgi:LemA protein
VATGIVTSVVLSVLFWWPWLLAAAVLLFWSVGAASRLRRLRAAVTRAFGALVPVWRQRLAWVQTRAVESDSEAAQRLVAAHGQCALALEHARDKPLDAARIRSLALAANVLDAAWAAAVADGLPLAAPDADAGGLTWDALGHQALPLQQAFNTQVTAYNHAIAQFPALVLTWALRFKRAEPLPVAESQT